MNFTRNLSRMAKSLLNSSIKQHQPFTVIVEGNIGSGKTTFLEYFKRLENITVMSEPIEMWRNCHGYNLLNKMYEDPKQWSFTFQSYVQLTMIKSHLYQPPLPQQSIVEESKKKSIKLMERSIYSARYCFVEKLYKDGVLTEPSLAVIDEWFKWLVTTQDYRVDLIVYLRTTPDIVYERIKQRNRVEEKLLPYEFIKDLHEIHENWLFHKRTYPIPAPVIVIDADLDLAVIEEEYGRCESQILEKATVSL